MRRREFIALALGAAVLRFTTGRFLTKRTVSCGRDLKNKNRECAFDQCLGSLKTTVMPVGLGSCGLRLVSVASLQSARLTTSPD